MYIPTHRAMPKNHCFRMGTKLNTIDKKRCVLLYIRRVIRSSDYTLIDRKKKKIKYNIRH